MSVGIILTKLSMCIIKTPKWHLKALNPANIFFVPKTKRGHGQRVITFLPSKQAWSPKRKSPITTPYRCKRLWWICADRFFKIFGCAKPSHWRMILNGSIKPCFMGSMNACKAFFMGQRLPQPARQRPKNWRLSIRYYLTLSLFKDRLF